MNKETAIKILKKFLIIPIILSILKPAITLSKMPPNNTNKKPNEAEIIVIGEVYDKGATLLLKNPPKKPDRPPLTQFIVLKVVHVIKGDRKITPNKLIHILSHDDPERQKDPNICHSERIFPFFVEKGILVIVYADTLPNSPSFYSKKTIFPFLNTAFIFCSF